jgi:uncharacterized protein YycO
MLLPQIKNRSVFPIKKLFVKIAMATVAVSMIAVSALSASAATLEDDKSSKYDPAPESVYDVQKIQSADNSRFQFDDATAQELIRDAHNQPIFPDKTVVGFETLSQNDAARRISGNGNAPVAKSMGTYPTRYGVILVTADAYKGLIPTGHAAIIWTSSTVVESLSGGVTTGSNNWNTTKTTCYGVTTYGTTAYEDDQASYYAYAQIGKPYNWVYPDRWTRSKFYCSQLVYAAYLDLYGIDLDTAAFLSAVHPMELVNSSNTYTIYQK